MGQGIQGPPNVYGAGLDFDYSVWTANTTLDLVNVRWNNDYRDVVKFDSKLALNTYIDSLSPASVKIENTTYAKPGQDIFLPVPYNRINRYNYLRASNPLMPIPGDIQKDFYYFILDCEYISPNTTRVRVQLDVWQTYVYDVEFGSCYLERGHIGIANTKNFDNYGRDYLTVPEGLDVGSDYRVIGKKSDEVVGWTGLTSEINVLVFSSTDLLADPGTVDDPKLVTGNGSSINGMPSGATAYVFPTVQQFTNWLATVKNYPWVTQGIVSVNAIPPLNRYLGGYNFTYNPVGPTRIINYWAYPIKHKFLANWRNNHVLNGVIPAKYRHLRKFFTAPYMVIELTTWSGTPVVLRPEAWSDPDAFVIERPTFMPPKQRVQFYPSRYNANNDEDIESYNGLTYEDLMAIPGMSEETANNLMEIWGELGDDFGDYLDVMTQIADFPALPVINNMALNYLASNAHSIDYQRKSAEWTQNRARRMASGAYDIQSSAMDTNQNLTDIANIGASGQTAIGNKNLAEQAAISGISGLVGGTAAGYFAFGPSGAVAGAASGAAQAIGAGLSAGAQAANNEASTALSNNTRQAETSISNRQAGVMRDTNYNLARFAANGDYANQLAEINSRVQDAAMIQPSIAGQFGGDSANLAHGTMEVSIRWKLIDLASIRIIGDFWLRYGYAIRAFITPPASLRVMSHFTYWKFNETYISSANIPEGHKQVIRGILEKGFTNWTDPNNIGNFEINNALPGVSY